MSLPEKQRDQDEALMRLKAVHYVEFLQREGLSLAEALREASLWHWPHPQGKRYASRTIECWWYAYSRGGFSSLFRTERSDKGRSSRITDELAAIIDTAVSQHPDANAREILRLVTNSSDRAASRLRYRTMCRYLSRSDFDFSRRRKPDSPTKRELDRQNEMWMLRLMQGHIELDELRKRLAPVISDGDTRQLLNAAVNGCLRQRNRSMTVLSFHAGIPKSLIARCLLIGSTSVDGILEAFTARGAEGLLIPPKEAPRKYLQEEFRQALFAIIHTPPSEYGINRTSWKQSDLHRVMAQSGFPIAVSGIRRIIRDAGYDYRKARKVLTSTDPEYREKLQKITAILSQLGPDEKFFSVDEFGPCAIKKKGGRELVRKTDRNVVPQRQKSKGNLIVTAALELSTNQITHFYSKRKNTVEMIRLLEVLLKQYREERCIYFSWDAASWHASKALYARVAEVNSESYRNTNGTPTVKLAPLPASAQFLNVIESVFSGMARAIIHNSDYDSEEQCRAAIDRYFADRNDHYKRHMKRAGHKIWGDERVAPCFDESNNCKDPRYR